MQALTLTAPTTGTSATFSSAPAIAVTSETGLLRGILYGVAIQGTILGAFVGSWMLVRHLHI